MISRIIIDEADAARFTFANFYARRARRILPAFLVVSAATMIAACWLFTPPELATTAASLLASLFFIGNVYFFDHSGYFDIGSTELPFLHYWSLGIEEQFYVFFPMLILAARKVSSRVLLPAAIAIWMISLIACQIRLNHNPSAAFYLLQFRAWELLTGAITFLLSRNLSASGLRANILGGGGLILIGGSLTLLTAQSRFPGLNALPVCLGSALFIYAGVANAALPQRIIGSSPLRFIGKISYSLYLVHWPMLIFANRIWPFSDPITRNVAACIASLALSAVLYFVVETPARRWRKSHRNAWILRLSAAAIAVSAVATGAIYETGGFKWRSNTLEATYASYLTYSKAAQFRADATCFLSETQTFAEINLTNCLPRPARKSVILWGDSGIAHYASALDEKFANAGYSMGQLTLSLCPPLLGYDVAARPQCKQFNELAIKAIINDKPDLVILGSAWPADLTIYRYLDASLKKLNEAGLKVVVLGLGPLFKEPVPIILANRLHANNPSTLSSPQELAEDEIRSTNKTISDVVKKYPRSAFLDIFPLICPHGTCQLVLDGIPANKDVFHTTIEGARFNVSLFFNEILNIAALPRSVATN